MKHAFLRRAAIYKGLGERLSGDARLVQVIIGPRQVGKTTTLRRYLEEEHGSNFLYFSADSPAPPSASWIVERWNEARVKARSFSEKHGPTILALDEVQKIPRWSEAVKACF